MTSNSSVKESDQNNLAPVENPSIEQNESVPQLTKNGMMALMDVIKASNNLPNDNWEYYSTLPDYKTIISNESQRILDILNDLLHHQNVRGNIVRRDNDDKYEMIIETNDAILERVDCNLDEMQGLTKNPDPVLGQLKAIDRKGHSFNHANLKAQNTQNGSIRSLTTTRLTARPQIKFKDKIDNSNSPFEPRIKEKPNSLKPLAILVEYDEKGECFSHPYEYELDLFKPKSEQLEICIPQLPEPVDKVPLVYVQDIDSLEKMVKDLKHSKEIAVDVEHHSYRSYQGFTCLVQISTRTTDYVVDALELRSELHILNDVFTDPKIVKVFHGAEHDIEWLQRDLCVYVVNMFDTHQASQILCLPRLSLAYLLSNFCNVNSNKQFQLYDWRTRPLSEAAMMYAREDTHYLLYLYDKLKNMLIEKCQNKTNLLINVIDRSTDLCKRKYWKFITTDDSHMEFYRKSRKMFDNKQMYVLNHLYQWRDKLGREEDESIFYVLPNHMLLNLAEALPRELQGISALCNPVPPLVKQHEREIHNIILKGRDQPLVKPVVVMDGDALNQSFQDVNWVPVNMDSKLYCPHDLTHNDRDDVRLNMPALIYNNLTVPTKLSIKSNKFIMKNAFLSLFEDKLESNLDWTSKFLKGKERNLKFVSPYQRYKKVIAFVQAEEQTDNSAATDDGPSPAKIIKLTPSEKQVESQQVQTLDSNQCTAEVKDVASNNTTTVKAIEDNRNQIQEDSTAVESETNKTTDACKSIEHQPTIVETQAKEISPVVNNNSDSAELKSDLENKKSEVKTNKIAQQTDDINRKRKGDNIPEANNIQKQQKKKINKDEKFQPFNYNNVDFTKFHSGVPPKQLAKSKPAKFQGRRTPWLGDKKQKGKK